MIEQLASYPDNIVAMVGRGHVTKADYDTVLVPAIVRALERHDRIRFYYELAGDFAGIDLGAMWEDFKIGMEHLSRWERVAIVTDVGWIRQAVRLWGFLMPAPLRIFSISEAEQAREWIIAAG